MPAPATVAELIDLIRKSGLIPNDRLDPLLAQYRAGGSPPGTVDALVQLLTRDGQLTFFQGRQLKLGRYKRFNIGSKYRLLELLGVGGMGAVYLCEHTLMRRLVALKVLPVEKLDDPSSLERFYREARAVAALNHPNIVRAHDIDQFDRIHFLAMEYVDGASLQEIVGRHGPMNPLRAAHYVAQSALGLQYAHELGMVHRDVKPGNLLLERTGVVKILDMGLARFFNKTQDAVTEKYDDKCVLGTADYLAPEQAVSSNVDVRADVYSLGGTLYFLLTGRPPFPDGSIAAKLVAHQKQDPKPVEEVRSDVPPGILAVLRRMMEKDPADRYQEPIEVAEALAEWSEQPIDPPPAAEMPPRAPAVLALSAPQAPAANGAAIELQRALMTGIRAGGGSGSSLKGPGGAGSGRLPSGSGRTPKAEPPPGSDSQVPYSLPVSTSRTSAAATAPHRPPPPRPAPGPVPTPPAADPPPASPARADRRPAAGRRWLVLVAYAGLALLLFAGGAVAAYLLLRNPGRGPGAGRLAPSGGEVVRAAAAGGRSPSAGAHARVPPPPENAPPGRAA